MKIVVVEPDGAGGMLHYAFQMCTALADEGATVTLVTSRHYELAGVDTPFEVAPIMRLWPAVEPAPPRGIAGTLGRKLRRIARGFRYAREWARATRFILERRPDVAQFAIIRFPFLSWFLRRIARADIAVTQVCHEFEPREARGPLRSMHRLMSRRTYRTFSAIFLHAEENRSRFLESYPVDPTVTTVIPHGDEGLFVRLAGPGSDLRERYDIPASRPVALFFGGLRPSKGLDDLIDAFPRVVDEVDAHLVIAGPAAGVDPADLRRRATDRRIDHRVVVDDRYLPMGEVASLMRTASIVVLPYRSATASGVLQVAYAFGRPVVATDVGALSEDVIPGETGLLVAPGDPHALAAALIKLLTDPAEASRMGTAAQDRAAGSYSWAPIARTVLDTYRRLT